jgi:4-amino-4-deoxy-L-arabinose transferase-like glycosyltransferase
MQAASPLTNRRADPPIRVSFRARLLCAALLLAGLLLRIFFLRRHAFLAGDSYLYQDIAQNWIHAHIYGLSTDTDPRPTLIRLPGYPVILAALAWTFDRWLQADIGTLRSFLPVLWLQIFADLGTCCIAAAIARRMFGVRAALAALALGCLCPFTANYTAVPLTETFTLFCLALAFFGLQMWMEAPGFERIALIAAALSASVLLRPDQGLLAVAVVGAMLLAPHAGHKRVRAALLCALLASLPFVPWTVRNARTFGVFQPLAPKLANDPGEVPARGFQHWYRTWAIDFSSTEDAYWKYPEETVQMRDLPDRAFDSSAERATAASLLGQAAATHKLSPAVEQGLTQLALQRAHRHPFRTYVFLPLARLTNMLLHPRDEMLPVTERWWQYRLHPAQTLLAWSYGLLSFAYFLLGVWGVKRAMRADRVLALSMIAYIGLRCALLLTLDNAEQRYTLEFFPILFVFGGAVLAWR